MHVRQRTMDCMSVYANVWIDTRNTQNIHRAGRFCHRFAFLPVGAGGKPDVRLATTPGEMNAGT